MNRILISYVILDLLFLGSGVLLLTTIIAQNDGKITATASHVARKLLLSLCPLRGKPSARNRKIFLSHVFSDLEHSGLRQRYLHCSRILGVFAWPGPTHKPWVAQASRMAGCFLHIFYTCDWFGGLVPHFEHEVEFGRPLVAAIS